MSQFFKNLYKEKQTFILFLLISLLFIPLLKSFIFIADDYWLIYAAIHNPLPLTSDWVGSDVNMFRPIIVFSMYLNHIVDGYNPFFYYLTNLLIHLVNTMILYRMLRRIGKTGNFKVTPPQVFGISLLFLIFPQNLINVFWISGRTDLICALFVFIAAYAFLIYYDTLSKGFLFISVVSQFLAFASKETAFIIVFYFAVILLMRKEYHIRLMDARKLLAIIFAPALIYTVYRFIIFRQQAMGSILNNNFSVTALSKYYAYGIWTMFLPVDILDIYYFYIIQPQIAYAILVVVALLVLASVFILWVNRKSPFAQAAFILIAVVIVALNIYIRSFPEMRLAYVFLPFVLATIVFIISLARRSAILQKSIIILFCGLLCVGNYLLIQRTMTINQYNRKLIEALPNRIDSTKIYYVITPLGRLGQSASAPQLGLMSYYKEHQNLEKRPLNFIAAGLYEGFSLSKPENNVRIKFLSPSHFYLEVKNSTDGIVPIASKKFDERREYQYQGMLMKMITGRKFRPGVAENCEVVFDANTKNEFIVVQ